MKLTTGATAGRKEDTNVLLAVEEIHSFIESNDECEFTLNELKSVCKDYVPDDKTIKSKLVINTLTVIYFTDAQYGILNKF